MATCTLEFGEQLVLLSKGGPPEAEFSLFDPGEIELASSGPGMVREIGYRTTAEEALRRLEALGVTLDVAQEAAAATIPRIATSYARGSVARRVALLLGPAELFDGGVYDFGLRRYEGRWLDLPALALDLELARATTLMQSLSLAARLVEVAPRTPIVLTTREYAASRRPGERSYRRVPIDHIFSLKSAIQAHAARGRRTPGPEREGGQTREEALEGLERRAASATLPSRAHLEGVVAALRSRARPPRGPLADPELWALEEQLASGNAAGVVESLDAFERVSGRSPATSYLRARASLLGGRESPRAIAERTSALAMSMTSFSECTLLAAEAWLAAGEPRRALPFARDLVANRDAPEDARARAARIVEENAQYAPPSSLPPPLEREGGPLGSQRPTPVAVSAVVDAKPPPSSLHKATPPLPFGIESVPPSDPLGLPPILSWDEPAIEIPTPTGAPVSSQRERVPKPASIAPHPPSGRRVSSAPYSVTAPSASRVTPPLASRVDAPRARSVAPPSPEPQLRKAHWAPGGLMRGGSQPPFRSDSRGAHAYIPKAPRVSPPQDEPEIAETLVLPPGLTGTPAPLDTLPSSVIDARVQFTFLSRDLAREYREERGVVLRIDLTSIEAMQAYLLERYVGRQITSVEDALDVHRHGALLSEILARTIDAFWVDIAPNDLGYWAMVVPPDTRVWPFGRILRLIAMQHRERDLVSYYLELRARAG